MKPPRTTLLRWIKFNTVGGIGIAVQLAILWALTSGLGLNYLAATVLAVEATITHNFLWHQRFTWPDRQNNRALARFLRFNLTTGMISILGNLALMAIFAGVARLPYIAANLATITICSLANFVVSDRLVFQKELGP